MGEEKLTKIRQKKETVRLDDLCAGLPDCFKAYLSYSRKLKFKERPNYVGMRNLFRDARPEHQEHQFQWFDKKNWGTLEPLVWNEVLHLRSHKCECPGIMSRSDTGCLSHVCRYMH